MCLMKVLILFTKSYYQQGKRRLLYFQGGLLLRRRHFSILDFIYQLFFLEVLWSPDIYILLYYILLRRIKNLFNHVYLLGLAALREKFPNTDFFQIGIQENTDQKNSVFGLFSRSAGATNSFQNAIVFNSFQQFPIHIIILNPFHATDLF